MPRPRAGSRIPAADEPLELDGVLELVALPPLEDPPEEPALEAVGEPVVTVLFVPDDPLPADPVEPAPIPVPAMPAPPIEATEARVDIEGMLLGVPAGEVAAASWEVAAIGSLVTTDG